MLVLETSVMQSGAHISYLVCFEAYPIVASLIVVARPALYRISDFCGNTTVSNDIAKCMAEDMEAISTAVRLHTRRNGVLWPRRVKSIATPRKSGSVAHFQP